MSRNVLEGLGGDPVRQFSVFLENKLGRLNDFTRLLANNSIHIMAMMVLDATENTLVRIIVDDPDETGSILIHNGYSFSETAILAVELHAVVDLPAILSKVLAAEINIHYLYPFLFRPSERSALAISLEDMDMASVVLTQSQFRILCQSDITR